MVVLGGGDVSYERGTPVVPPLFAVLIKSRSELRHLINRHFDQGFCPNFLC